MRVGFAGLGRMGAPMARNFVVAGHEVAIWNRSRPAGDALAAELGCAMVDVPADLIRRAEVVVTMLADDPAPHAVHLSAQGLFAGQGALVFIEMGTLSPDHVAALFPQAPTGTTVIDAPVSDSTGAAGEVTLLIMAGCTELDAAPLRPVLDALGREVICFGAPGRGAVMKLAVNSLIHGINQTLAEAMSLAAATGIDPVRAFDVIEASTACAPMLKYRRPLYLDEAAHEAKRL